MKKLHIRWLLFIILSLALGVSVLAQGTEVEINPFAGGSFFRRQNYTQSTTGAPFRFNLNPGGTAGVRVTENLGEHFALEQSWNVYGVNNVRFDNATRLSGRDAITFGNRLYQFAFNGVYHFTPRDAAVRPFITVGGGLDLFTPTGKAKRAAFDPSNPLFGTAGGPVLLDNSLQAAVNYGAGIKMRMAPHIGVRFDARGFLSRTPSFNLPAYGPGGTLTLPSPGNSRRLNGLQLTGGLTFHTGAPSPVWSAVRGGGGDIVEINGYGGASLFARRTLVRTAGRGPVQLKLVDGGIAGLRVTENGTNFLALEQDFGIYGTNNVRLYNVPGSNRESVTFGNRLHSFHFNVIGHMTPRDRWVRPFILAGYGFQVFVPTDDAKRAARNGTNPLFGTPTGPVGLSSSLRPSFDYGGGIKLKMAPAFGLRFDARGFLLRTPRFGAAQTGPVDTLAIPGRRSLSGLQLTGGLTFYPGATTPAGVTPFQQYLTDGGELVELNFFGGGSFFRRREFNIPGPTFGRSANLKLVSGYITGVRVTENLWDYFGFEQDLGIYGGNNVRFRNVPGVPNNQVTFSSRLHQFSFNVVGHLTPRDSWIRPFATAGLGFNVYRPTSQARREARDTVNPLFGTAGPVNLGQSLKTAFNYGVGVKAKLTPYFGLRFDARGYLSQTPFFGIPKVGPPNTLVIPKGGALHGLQVTGGGTFYFGQAGPKIVHDFTVPPAIEVSGAAELCPGESVTMRLPVRDTIASHRGRYRWTVNGQDAPEGAGPEFRFTAPQNAGNYTIAVHVEDDTSQSTDKAEIRATRKAPGLAADRTTAVRVKEYKPPTATCAADNTNLQRGQTTNVRVTGTGSECSGELSYRWTASEGTITGGATAQYDSTNVQFDPNITDREQTKNVTLTATVTDPKGGSATCAVNLTVRYRATALEPKRLEPIRLDDIIFAPGNARVNNCAKRILADELYPQMTRNRDYDIVLVGHMDANESAPAAGGRRGRRGRTATPTALDRERVLNTAAFLSAGSETCKDIEVSRIKVDWVGTDQTSDFKSRFCETSVEKKGQAIRSNDPNAKNRRVEIWLVPKGAPMPPAIKALKDAPTADIQAKGCPK